MQFTISSIAALLFATTAVAAPLGPDPLALASGPLNMVVKEVVKHASPEMEKLTGALNKTAPGELTAKSPSSGLEGLLGGLTSGLGLGLK